MQPFVKPISPAGSPALLTKMPVKAPKLESFTEIPRNTVIGRYIGGIPAVKQPQNRRKYRRRPI